MTHFIPPLSLQELETAFDGAYTILEIVASGGQGVVLKGKEIRAGTLDVAIKIYFPGSVEERTNREIAALRVLRSPYLTRIHDSGTIGVRGKQCVFVVTDYVLGSPLSEALETSPLQRTQVILLGICISKAVEALWSERIVHRDIKPANIMLTKDGDAVLIDLGVARHLLLNAITTVGKTWGSEGYMSPEHARAVRQLSCKTDVFSLGIVLQQSLCGRHPTDGDQMKLMFGGVKTASIAPSVCPMLGAIVDRMVSFRPELRPSPKAIREELMDLS